MTSLIDSMETWYTNQTQYDKLCRYKEFRYNDTTYHFREKEVRDFSEKELLSELLSLMDKRYVLGVRMILNIIAYSSSDVLVKALRLLEVVDRKYEMHKDLLFSFASCLGRTDAIKILYTKYLEEHDMSYLVTHPNVHVRTYACVLIDIVEGQKV